MGVSPTSQAEEVRVLMDTPERVPCNEQSPTDRHTYHFLNADDPVMVCVYCGCEFDVGPWV